MTDYLSIYTECMADCEKYLQLSKDIMGSVKQTEQPSSEHTEEATDPLVKVAQNRVIYLRQYHARTMVLDEVLSLLQPFCKEFGVKVVRMTNTTCNLKCFDDVVFTISSEKFGVHINFVNNTKRTAPYIIPLSDINVNGLKALVIEMANELYRLDMID